MSAKRVVSDFFADDGAGRVLVYDDGTDVPRPGTVAEARAEMVRFAESLEPGSPVRGAWEELAAQGVFGVVFVTDEMAEILDRFQGGEAS
jgi:hypothetical protein